MASEQIKNAYYNSNNTGHYMILFGQDGGLVPNKSVIIGQKGNGTVVPVLQNKEKTEPNKKRCVVKPKKRKVYPLYAMK